MVLAFTPSELALSSVKNVTAGADVTASNNPEICELYDMHTETKGTVLSAGYTVRITGRRLKVAGNEE
jgi:hypothetical protein